LERLVVLVGLVLLLAGALLWALLLLKLEFPLWLWRLAFPLFEESRSCSLHLSLAKASSSSTCGWYEV